MEIAMFVSSMETIWEKIQEPEVIRQYELTIVVDGRLKEREARQVIEHVRRLLKSAPKGEIVAEEHIGIRQLAYLMNKSTHGFYHVFEFRAEPAFIQELEEHLRHNELILRFLTVRMDKYAIKYREEKRQQQQQQTAKTITKEDTKPRVRPRRVTSRHRKAR